MWDPERPDRYSLYVAAAPGTGSRQRVSDPEAERSMSLPAWSPDGTQLAYASQGLDGSSDPNDNEIVIVDADGGNRRALTSGAFVRQYEPSGGKLAWSPDGRSIAFSTAGTSSTAAVAVVDVGTGSIAPLIDANDVAYRIVGWLPDGSGVVAQIGGGGVIVVPVDGSPSRVVSETMWAADLSPDGAWVAGILEGGVLNVVRTDGTDPRALGSVRADNRLNVAWSRNGDAILFATIHDGRAGGLAYVRLADQQVVSLYSGPIGGIAW